MKKSVVILIGIIYVAAIILVSFYGLQFKVFDQIVPVEKIEILNEGLKDNDLWGKYAVVSVDANGEAKYQIQYRVYPDNASDTKVHFSYDPNTKCATVDENGLITFNRPGVISIIITPMDGGDVSAQITVVATK